MRTIVWHRGMTLAEILIVLVILAIFVSLSVPRFERAMESAIGREARVNLEFIADAEAIVRLQSGGYRTCADTANCNQALNLILRGANWDYWVDNVAVGPPATFLAHARRTGGSIGYLGSEITLSQDRTWGGNWPISY